MNPMLSDDLVSTASQLESMEQLSIGEFLIKRLQDHGIDDMFGVPGDYVLTLYGMLEQSPINMVGCTREDSAGFAADAYARIQGMGAVCVTYCVGGLSLCNSIAGAFAEKSPVVVVTGSPGLSERINNPLLHHKVRDFHTQRDVFEKICVAGTELTDPVTAFREIDRVLDAAARFKRPVYIDLPRDMVQVVPHLSYPPQRVKVTGNPLAASEAAEEVADLLCEASRPVIIAGVEIHRFGLQDQLLKLAEESQIPIVTTLLGKSVIRETHPLYVGLYEGAIGHQHVTRFVEQSDCLLLLGTFMTDLNLGIYTANLDHNLCIEVTSEQLRIRHHHYHGVALADFLKELTRHRPRPGVIELPKESQQQQPAHQVRPGEAVTIKRLVERLNEQLDEQTIVIADIGDSLFAATEIHSRGRSEFLSPAYYTSMGFSVPAALGASIARPGHRVLVICGDGAFQMTGMELSTIIRNGFAPIVIVLDNGGYGTERFLFPGEWRFNDIAGWNYAELPRVLGGGQGFRVRSEDEFDRALTSAWQQTDQVSLIHVELAQDDASPTLRRLAERMAERI